MQNKNFRIQVCKSVGLLAFVLQLLFFSPSFARASTVHLYPPTFDPQKIVGLSVREALPHLGLRIEDLQPRAEPPGKLQGLYFGRWRDDSAPWGCIYLKYLAGGMFSIRSDWSTDAKLNSAIIGIKIINGKTILSAGDVNDLVCLVK